MGAWCHLHRELIKGERACLGECPVVLWLRSECVTGDIWHVAIYAYPPLKVERTSAGLGVRTLTFEHSLICLLKGLGQVS